jgi:glycerophosphoryl diester phosphodiesterase
MKWRSLLSWGIILAIAGLTLFNASWIAPKPEGALKLVAHRGATQQYTPGPGCPAARMRPPTHDYIDNSLRGIEQGFFRRADWALIDLQRTKDGQLVIFSDDDLACRTNGSGTIGDKTLAELQRLDIGHGYSADGGKTFPLRGGKGVGAMPSLANLLRAMPRRQFIFRFVANDPADADALIAAFKAAGRTLDGRYAFTGGAKPVAAMKAAAPLAWIWDGEGSKACAAGYFKTGWLGLVPDACRGGTMAVPVDSGLSVWGWPYRFLKRMSDAGTRVVITGPDGQGGVAEDAQLDSVPIDFTGFLLLDDIHALGPAIRP